MAIKRGWISVENISEGGLLKHRERGRIILKIDRRTCEDGKWNIDYRLRNDKGKLTRNETQGPDSSQWQSVTQCAGARTYIEAKATYFLFCHSAIKQNNKCGR